MPLVPDAPFPKTPGNPIMAKDWNDAIAEVQRLDTAKVGRTGTETMSGPLTINNALTVGTTAAGAARLHVLDSVTPAVARVQTTAVNGSARLELWSDPRGGANEWRPGYIESFDTGTFTGGLRFFTNGTGSGNKQGSLENFRVVNGVAGFGVTDPTFRIDALGPIRSRLNGGVQGGMWVSGTSVSNRAFFGLLSDSVSGIQGAGSGWTFQMDNTTGNVGIKQSPAAGSMALSVTGDANVTGNLGVGTTAPGFKMDVVGRARFRDAGAGNAAGFWLHQATASPQDRAFIGMVNDNALGLWAAGAANWGMQMDIATGNMTCQRVWTTNYRGEALASNLVSTNSTTAVQVPSLSLTFTLPTTRTCWINVVIPGVEVAATAGGWTIIFRLMVDSTEICSTTQIVSVVSGQTNVRTIKMSRLYSISGGSAHTVRVDYQVVSSSATLSVSSNLSERVLQVVEF